MNRYYTYNEYLINKFQEKTYKLAINIPVTCPNRDGTIGYGGCTFCSEQGTGFEATSNHVPIIDQLKISGERVSKRYKAKKFIAYFQNYTNTYLPLQTLLTYMEEAYEYGVVGIDIATRPDMIQDDYLEAIRCFSHEKKVHITFEIGLQIANDQILEDINRGHSVAVFEDAVKRIKNFGFSVCVHLILNLPNSTMKDIKVTSKLLNSLSIDIVKFHSLYIPKDSLMASQYLKGDITIGSFEEYVSRALYLITHCRPDMAISRLVSRIPKEDSVFSNWDMSWWKVYNTILNQLEIDDLYQGIYYDQGDDK